MIAQDILDFWFEECGPEKWFKKDTELDEHIQIRFAQVHKAASRGELFKWRDSAFGRLAEIIVLDQFSRNIYRGQPESFANDQLALILAQEMVQFGLDKEVPVHMRAFVYMPYMHSESRIIHEEAIRLFSTEGLEENLIFERDHKKIIDQFGRYPHRNGVLHRLSTIKELEFMQNHRGF